MPARFGGYCCISEYNYSDMCLIYILFLTDEQLENIFQLLKADRIVLN
jgi:hypothetical protein